MIRVESWLQAQLEITARDSSLWRQLAKTYIHKGNKDIEQSHSCRKTDTW